jgi:lipopolysaccharide/colanic/teichoic acid biosynthesis glycosyltransferase
MSAHPAHAAAPFVSRSTPVAWNTQPRFRTEQLAGGILLILLSPLLAVVAVIVAVLSGRTPFIAHRRVGQQGSELWMLKLRSMWGSSAGAVQSAGGQRWRLVEYLPDAYVPNSKCFRDPRITSSLAAFLRRFSVDELPQLLHVVTGRMRLVGPRPITFAEWHEHYGESASEVLSVPPGITGLWQVLGRSRLTYAQRRRLDLFYARHCGSRLDWWILLRTPFRVLSGRDSI